MDTLLDIIASHEAAGRDSISIRELRESIEKIKITQGETETLEDENYESDCKTRMSSMIESFASALNSTDDFIARHVIEDIETYADEIAPSAVQDGLVDSLKKWKVQNDVYYSKPDTGIMRDEITRLKAAVEEKDEEILQLKTSNNRVISDKAVISSLQEKVLLLTTSNKRLYYLYRAANARGNLLSGTKYQIV